MRALAIAACLALVATIGTLPPADTLPPCQYEDSNSCYWDASIRGNGLGVSFIAP